MSKNTISLQDHRFKYYESQVTEGNFSYRIVCSCGKDFDKYGFFSHQKKELNKQLKNNNIEVEVV